jgi:hypothetical protein
MGKFKSPRSGKSKPPPSQQGAIPCLILIAMLFAFIGLVFYAAVRGT